MTPRPLTRFIPAVAVLTSVAALSTAPAALAGAERSRTAGELHAYSDAIPAGSHARVQAIATAAGSTIVTLHAWGLKPNSEYGAHAHTNACGLTGTDAGPHFQYEPGGVTDPAYANPTNEIWLDFTTDEDGNAVAQTTVPWQFEVHRRAKSVIIHEDHTSTIPGSAGTAGPRLACLTVAF